MTQAPHQTQTQGQGPDAQGLSVSSRSVFAGGVLAGLSGLGYLARQKAAAAERTHPPLGEIVDIDGTPVHFVRQGAGPTIILIHGAGGNVRDFTFELAGKMAKTNDVIAFDRPGHGYTGCLNRLGESPREQAELIHKAALRIGVRSAIICGYSFGGAVALAWGLGEPEFVTGLLLISAASHPWPGGVGLLFSSASNRLTAPIVAPMIAAFAPTSIVDKTLASVFRPRKIPPGYLDYIGAGLSLRVHSVLANTRQVVTLKRHVLQMAKRYHELEMPTEILHGTEDRTVYAALQSEVLARTLPNARYTKLHRVGHSPHHHAHQEILAALGRLNALH